MTALSLALAAAFCFALGNQCSKIALRYTDSRTTTLYQIGVGTALYWLASPFYMKLEYWLSPALLMLAAIGLFRPIISANLGMAGTRHLGPTISSTLSATSPIFGVALGVLALGEALSWEIALGAGSIFVGVVMLSWHRGTQRDWPAWALLLPVGAALIRSVAHVFAKIGMESVPSPFFVALIAYTVSFVLALGIERRAAATRPAPAALPWLLATGCVYGVAVLFLNAALMSGRLVVVSPIIGCSPLFTLILGLAVFKERSLDARVAAAVLVVVAGVILIGLRR